MKIKVLMKNDYFTLSVATMMMMLFVPVNTSPLVQSIGGDGACFLSFGKWITQGMVPYRDFFDHKGPILWFFEALPQFFVKGPVGVWVLQLIFMFFSVVIVYKIARVLTQNPIYHIITPIVYLVLLSTTIEGGNYSEEICNPFNLLVAYLFIFHHHRDFESVGWSCGFLSGISFMFVVLVRPNNGAMIYLGLLFFLIALMNRKKYKELMINSLSFIGGIALVFLPVAVYYIWHGAFQDMIYGAFIFNYKYSQVIQSGFFEFFLKNMKFTISYIFLSFLGVLGGILEWVKQRNLLAVFTLLSVILNGIMVMLPSRPYQHYLIISVGSAVLGFVLILRNSASLYRFSRWSLSIVSALLLIYIAIAPQLPGSGIPEIIPLIVILYGTLFSAVIWAKMKKVSLKPTDAQITKRAVIFCLSIIVLARASRIPQAHLKAQENKESHIAIANLIPEEDKDSVYCYDAIRGFYVHTDIKPTHRYNMFQRSYIETDPAVRDEIIEFFKKTPPTVLIVPKLDIPKDQFMVDIIEEQYDFKYLYNKNEIIYMLRK